MELHFAIMWKGCVSMQRIGQVIRLKPEMEEKYRELHANAWPEVLAKIEDCNIRNYSIFLRDGYLFAYMEYIGNDFAADMAKMAEDPMTQLWWKETDPCQMPVETAGENVWWADMEEVFHTN